MNKIEYYIQCTCINDMTYPNVEFHVGDIVYYNKNASSAEMYLYYSKRDQRSYSLEELRKIGIPWKWCCKYYLPLTRRQDHAKRWQVKSAAKRACIFIDTDIFKPEIKEIKITYSEEV